MNRIGVGQRRGDDRVAGFVIGDTNLFVLVHHAVLLFQSRRDPFDRFVELVDAHGPLFGTRGQQGSFVDQVGQVGADKPRCDRGDFFQVDFLIQFDVLDVDSEDILASADIGTIDQHVPVKATGTQQRGIERFGSVGRRDDDHAASWNQSRPFRPTTR